MKIVKYSFSDILSQERIQLWMNRPNHQLSIGVVAESERSVWTSSLNGESDHTEGIYEIGSITKTIIGLLLSIGEQEGIWNRTEKLSDFVPEWACLPFAQQTSLLDLVTHTSGLPRIPANLGKTIVDKLNPYANYSEDHLIEAVRSERPTTNKKHLYSNYGFGLLGWLLSRRLGKNLCDSLQEHVFQPLRMNSTDLGSNAQTIPPVFDSKGRQVPHWDFQDATAGAGAVRSTITDMLSYIEANLSPSESTLGTALEECRKQHHSIEPGKGIGIGYAWMLYQEKDGSTTWWHNGGTYGSSSFAAFNLDKKTGFVILSNYGVDLWSQLPIIGARKMTVDRLAQMLTSKLF